jgi:RNA polymerase sigma-70 factor (family 1)
MNRTSSPTFSPDMLLLAEGNQQTFNDLYEKYYQGVYANIFKLVKSPEFAEDILQDVFESLWKNRQKMGNVESVSSWLFVVSYNKSLSFLKRKLRSSLEFVADYGGYEEAISIDESDDSRYALQVNILNHAVKTLPARKREVFTLCKMEGRSKEEVASLLSISPDTVKDYLKQSTKHLRHYIHTHYQGVELAALLLLMIG